MTDNSTFDLSGKRVWVAGHRGMVGAALVRRLGRESCEVLTVGRERLDLRRQAEVEERPPDRAFTEPAPEESCPP